MRYLLNEKNEVMAILKGKRIDKKRTYRSCYLLAKYYKSLGYNMVDTRKVIFEWANKYKITITDDLNSIIQRAFRDKKELVNNVEIRISDEDIKEIISRFDRYNTRLLAFGILCYAKLYADESGLFYMSQVGLSNWLGISQSALSDRYLKELIDFCYIEKVSKKDVRLIRYRNKHASKILVYRIKVKHENTGNHIVRDEDIIKEFENIFAIYE